MATDDICLIQMMVLIHIFEYLFGIYLHLWSILKIKYIVCILINNELDIGTIKKTNTRCKI